MRQCKCGNVIVSKDAKTCKKCQKLNWAKRGSISCKRVPLTEARKLALKTCTIKHHKYLKEFSDEVIKMTQSGHSKLHNKAYEFIFLKYGKEGIDNFLKWFNEKYGGII
jgi:hypothetical protein